MFATEPKSQCYTRPATAASYSDNRARHLNDEMFQGIMKYKQARNKARSIQKQFQSTLSNVNHLRRTIDFVKHQTCKKRLDFVKSFETKKLKIQSYEMEEQKKLVDMAQASAKHKHRKTMKLSRELQSMINKQEMNRNNMDKQKKNKQQKINRKSQYITIMTTIEIDAKQKYERIKQKQINLKQKLKLMSQNTSLRARHYYESKKDRELLLIESYEKILKEVEKYDELLGPEPTAFEPDQRQFFITEKKPCQETQTPSN